MDTPVWPLGIVRELLELPLEEGDFEPVAKLVDRRCRPLMLGQDGMQFVDEALRELAAAGNTVGYELNSRLLISEDVDQS